MKKLIALVLAAIMLLLCGCAEKKTEIEPTDGKVNEQTDPEPAPEPAPDGGEEGGEESAEEKTFDFGKGLTEDGYFEGIDALSLVTLPDFEALEIPENCYVADAAEVEYQITYSVLSQYGDEDTEKVVEDGDTVNIDYVGSIDGVPFAGGSTDGAGTEVTIGVTNYIDGFLPQLIGHKPGDNFDIDVTFPEDYGSVELAGKPAVFNITINYVKLPATELTDEMAADFGFDTAESLIRDVEEWVISQSRSQYFSELVLSAEYKEVPASLIELMKDNVVMQYELNYDYDLSEERDEYIEYYESNVATMEDMAKEALFALAIAQREGVVLTTEDIENYGMSGYTEAYGEPFVKNQILIYRTASDLIFGVSE